ncbi:hypothetical protein ES707_21863 [subsurface metagenome]
MENLVYHGRPIPRERYLRSSYARRLLEQRLLETGERARPEEDAKKAKKELFINQGPRTFYFLDEEAVNELYPQIFKEVEPVETQTEERETKEGGIRAKLHFVEPMLGKTTGVTVRRTYVKEQNLGAMFNQIESFLVENDQVLLGLEDFAEHEPSVEEFRSMCRQMDERFQFKVPAELQEQYIKQQQEALALQKVKELKQAHDYILMRGVFSVGSTDNQWSLVYSHPLNNNLASIAKRVTIAATCPKERSSKAGAATFSNTATVNLTLFGKVVFWTDDSWVLQINPLAIY